MSARIENARITDTFLGIEGHGMFTFIIQLDFKEWSQAFGTYAIDTFNTETKQRDPSAVAGYAIARILKIAGVDQWEKLEGRYVRAKIEGGMVRAIGPILGDPDFDYDGTFWFTPADEFKQFEKDGEA
jgi:hypothetical protein